MKEEEIKELSDKHKLFVSEYVKNNCNATKAYMAVYDVDSESARRLGSLLLTNIDIKAAVNKEIDRILSDKKELTLQVINEYKKIAFSDMSQYIDPMTGENVINENTEKAVIKSIQFDTVRNPNKDNPEYREKFKFELYNKQNALDSISKLVLGLSEKHELTGKNGEPLDMIINIVGTLPKE
ncbi:MAG: terminase small subunit [Ignavibacteria bacterium]|nr:terminase small subunit [Ignavibacteria bacterium]